MRLSGRFGQSAVELMVVLAISLIAVLMIFALSQQKMIDTQASLSLSQAKSAVENLAKSADEVYSEGVNSTKVVYVTIPDAANLTRSSISGHSINLAIGTPGGLSDVNARAGETVFGSWPGTPGGYWLTVTAFEGSVQIGPAVVQVSPASIYAEMYGASSVQENMTVTNFGEAALTVDGTLSWNAAEVSVGNTSALDFPLPSGSSQNATLLIYASSQALGPYSGSVTFAASNGETITVPLTVHVSAQDGSTVNVSYVTIETFKNSSYDVPKLIFDGPANATFQGSAWPAGAALTLYVYNSTGSQIASAPVTANATGGFSYVWSPAGLPGGTYSVNVTDSSPASMRSQQFSVGGC